MISYKIRQTFLLLGHKKVLLCNFGPRSPISKINLIKFNLIGVYCNENLKECYSKNYAWHKSCKLLNGIMIKRMLLMQSVESNPGPKHNASIRTFNCLTRGLLCSRLTFTRSNAELRSRLAIIV